MGDRTGLPPAAFQQRFGITSQRPNTPGNIHSDALLYPLARCSEDQKKMGQTCYRAEHHTGTEGDKYCAETDQTNGTRKTIFKENGHRHAYLRCRIEERNINAVMSLQVTLPSKTSFQLKKKDSLLLTLLFSKLVTWTALFPKNTLMTR